MVGGALTATLTPRFLSPGSGTTRWSLVVGGAPATGVAVGLLATRFGATELLAFACLAAIGVVLSSVDLLEQRLPARLVIPGLLVLGGLLAAVAVTQDRGGDLVRALCAATALAVAYLAVALASRGGLGAGDVKVGGLLGMALG